MNREFTRAGSVIERAVGRGGSGCGRTGWLRSPGRAPNRRIRGRKSGTFESLIVFPVECGPERRRTVCSAAKNQGRFRVHAATADGKAATWRVPDGSGALLLMPLLFIRFCAFSQTRDAQRLPVSSRRPPRQPAPRARLTARVSRLDLEAPSRKTRRGAFSKARHRAFGRAHGQFRPLFQGRVGYGRTSLRSGFFGVRAQKRAELCDSELVR